MLVIPHINGPLFHCEPRPSTESTPGPRLQPDTFEPLTRASVLAHLRATGGAAVLRRDQVPQVAQVAQVADGQTSERAPQSVSARGWRELIVILRMTKK